jgi:hypothetical protein
MDDIKNLTSEQAISNLRAAGYTKQADAFEKNLKGVTTINADKLGQTKTNVPTTAPQNNTDLSLGVLTSGASMGNIANFTQENILSEKAGLYTKVMDLLGQTRGESKRRGELLEDEGAFDLKKQITGYQNQLAAEERAFELERRRLMENPEGVFGPNALNSQISNLESKSLQRRADIAILGNAASNNLQTALDIVDMKIENEFGPAKEELNIFKQQLEFASPFLGEISSYLKDQADEKEKKIKEQQAWKKEILNLAVDAQQNGNTALANRLVSMSNGEVDENTYQTAVASAISGGVYSPKASTTVSQFTQDIEDFASQVYAKEIDEDLAVRVLKKRYPNKSTDEIKREINYILKGSSTFVSDKMLQDELSTFAADYGMWSFNQKKSLTGTPTSTTTNKSSNPVSSAFGGFQYQQPQTGGFMNTISNFFNK